MQSRRFMDSINPISCNPTLFEDFNPPQSRVTKNLPPRILSIPIASISDYPGTLWNLDRSRGSLYLVTTATPHGLSNFQLIQFSGDCNAVATRADSSTFSFGGTDGFVYVVDGTSFVTQPGYDGGLRMVGRIANPTGRSS